MISNSILSAWSIFIALFGVTLNAIFIRPYTGASYLVSETKIKQHKVREIFGRIANVLIVIGTLGQLVSIIISF